MKSLQRVMNTMASMFKKITASCTVNGLPMLSLLVWWAISVSTTEVFVGGSTECVRNDWGAGIIGIARRTKSISYSCNLNSSFIDNWDVNAHVMTRNKYGVFEILVDPTSDGKVAIPHGSKIKVKWQQQKRERKRVAALNSWLTNLTLIRSLWPCLIPENVFIVCLLGSIMLLKTSMWALPMMPSSGTLNHTMCSRILDPSVLNPFVCMKLMVRSC